MNKNIDWTNVGLGIKTDKQIAQELFITEAIVYNRRKSLGISSVKQKNIDRRKHWLKSIDWNKVGLGKKPDSEIARELKSDRRDICEIRNKLKIKPFIGVILTQEGDGCRSIYEAMYDAYLHDRKTKHKHEVRVKNLPYIADFKIGKKYIEIFGMKTYSRYLAKMNKKIEDYKINNIAYQEVTIKEIEQLYKNCNTKIKFREKRKCSKCDKTTIKLVKGFCHRCYVNYYHERFAETKKCKNCGKKFLSVRKSKFCSYDCYWASLNSINWPSNEWFEKNLKNRSYKEVAQELGCPLTALYVRLSRIRKQENREKTYLTNKVSLDISHPELVSEWDTNKNLPMKNFSHGSCKKVWWICQYGHKWEAVVNSRVKGSGCPICYLQSIRKVSPKTDEKL